MRPALLQFVRSRAAVWNIDKTRIGASGGSAGACSSLWLAFHDDLAEPRSSDPVSRESTRLLCAGVVGPQTSLDPKQMKEWTPNSVYGGHAFGLNGDKAKKLSSFQQFLESREQILPWINEYSPYELVTPDDPPVYLYYTVPPALGKKQRSHAHIELRRSFAGKDARCRRGMHADVSRRHQPSVPQPG